MRTVVFLGDKASGKSVLVHRYISQSFRERYIPTIGVDTHIVNLPDGECVNIHDYEGMKDYLVDSDPLLKKTDIAVIVFDLTSKESWQTVDEYIEKFDSDVPVLLCGNKADSKRAICPSTLNREYNMLKMEYKNIFGLVETSALNAINTTTLFQKLTVCKNNHIRSPFLF